MTTRYSVLAFFGACSLLLAGPVSATGTRPGATQAARPAPPRRTSAAPRPVAGPAVAAAVATPQPEAAPHIVVLSGTIMGADGRPCPGVCVFPTASPRLIAVTDATGTFHLQVPASAGTLRLQADYFGIGSSHIEVDGQHPQPISIVLGK